MSAAALSRRRVLAGGAVLLAGAGLAAAQEGEIAVMIEDLAFDPQLVEAQPGQTIVWTNRDAFDHTATVEGGWDIPIPAGGTARHVVTAEDGVSYYCRFHPNMTGEIRLLG